MGQIHYVKDFKNMIHVTILITEKLLTIKEKGTEKNSPENKTAVF